jgi:hypothetical protein
MFFQCVGRRKVDGSDTGVISTHTFFSSWAEWLSNERDVYLYRRLTCLETS